MEILVILLMIVVFGFFPFLGILIIVGCVINNRNPNFFPRVLRFLSFLLLPHKYLHQMYSYEFKNARQGYKINVQYVYKNLPYEGNGLNYYEAIWNAANIPSEN